mgnify:CR=1 FL=1
MGIAGVFVIWLFLTIFFIIEFIQCIIKGIVFPVESLWMLIILWFIVFMIIAGFILYRKSTQKRFSKVLENDYSNNFNNYREGEYFYQSPLITLDSQYIPIHGNKKMYYVPNFNNFLHFRFHSCNRHNFHNIFHAASSRQIMNWSCQSLN